MIDFSKAIHSILNNEINVYFLMKRCGKDSDLFRKEMENLSNHSQNKHDNCTFHAKIICSCGNCEKEGPLRCQGKQQS